ncbi:MAG TPA: aminotransferase class I/II-fold pyridoxal phosphate-dependent enzyme [Acholeplasmataceae bacterium]|nr:aminotransferase class I/II-fold pyridoxal phosphate-dependent enzyme [Acholeplasmataceae bacterium]
MYSFKNDYSELAHESILELLNKYSSEQNSGYGLDSHSEKAKELIKKYFEKDVAIEFLIGGTSCNKIAISHLLRPYEAVISADTGHINVHEAGAIEATGHKIITVPSKDGKIEVCDIEKAFLSHSGEHMVVPKMVYISNSTELGTIYTKSELEKISKFCKENDLYFYIDGARLGAALTANENDLTLNDISNLCDMFYIGGTKNGALLGEALIICNEKLKKGIRNSIKLNGGMLAKGFLIGIQFEALFTDELFFTLSKKANKMAKLLTDGLKGLGIKIVYPSPTNQQFVEVDNMAINKLREKYQFEVWEKGNEKSIIRLVTSWATTPEAIKSFIADLKASL